MSVVVLAIVALVVIAVVAGLAIFLAMWAHDATDARIAGVAAQVPLRQRIDDLTAGVQDRDRVIKDKTDELARSGAALAETEKHRAEAMVIVERFAASNPAAVSDAMRIQLARLRVLPKLPDVPDVPGPAASPAGAASADH